MRGQLEEFAHDLIVMEKAKGFDRETMDCAHERRKPMTTSIADSKDDGIGDNSFANTESSNVISGKHADPAGVGGPPKERQSLEPSNQAATTQAAGEEASEARSSASPDLCTVTVVTSISKIGPRVQAKRPSTNQQKDGNGDGLAVWTLPIFLAEGVETRAFPLAEGISCAAFHALAAEAVWAGFNGSNRVDKPPELVWHPRGGDRWGTAAFFAEEIADYIPKLPVSAYTLCDKEGGAHTIPLTGSSAKHASARRVCLAAVSSRRGFLKEAMETAANEV